MVKGLLIRLLICCAPAMAIAEEPSPNNVPPAANSVAPGQPRSSGSISTADFFRRPRNHGALISPDGKRLAALVESDDVTKLGVIDLDKMKITAAYSVADNEIIYDFLWANPTRLVFDTVINDGPLDEPYYTGHVYAGDYDHKNDTTLTGVDGRESLIGPEENDPDHVIVQQGSAVFSQNIRSGTLKILGDLPYDDSYFATDHHNRVRLVSGIDKDDYVTAYLDDESDSWKVMNRQKKTGGTIIPVGFTEDNQYGYVKSDADTATEGVFEISIPSGEKKLIFRDDHVDLGAILYAPGSEVPAGVIYTPDYPTYKFFDNSGSLPGIYSAMQDAYPDEFVKITSSSKDGLIAIVFVGSDVDPGRYVLLDVANKKLTPLFEERPWLDPAKMAQMNAITLKARDGRELRGYLTVPAGAKPHMLPMVVLVHGGPHGIRDQWGFNSEVQFLAYHGYAVLQVNYRGSGGYGRDFEATGYRHWGTTMQDDVTDATHWAIDQGVADPHRIAIYGASYGGYAALMGVIREPDLYRCAIGYDGAYDLTVQVNDSDTADSASGRAYLKKAVGEDPKDLQARSPVFNVDRIKVPLFLAHGRDDKRTPYKGFQELTAALDKQKVPYQSMVKDYEGHGFYKESNQVDFYDTMLKFLDKNTAPATAP